MLQQQLLEQVCDRYALFAGGNRGSVLQTLRPPLAMMRQAFSTSATISLDYALAAFQVCYLFAYYPAYVAQTGYSLRRLLAHPALASLLRRDTLNVALLGSGPMPEALALAQVCRQQGLRPHLNLTSLDLRVDGWAPARAITEQLVQCLGLSLTTYAEACDFGQTDRFSPAQLARLQSADLVIVQNCCNELPPTQRQRFAAQLRHLLAGMAPGSTLLLSDLPYAATTLVMNQLLTPALLQSGYHLLLDDRTRLEQFSLAREEPDLLRRHFFADIDGLRARRTVRHRSLCLHRSHGTMAA